NAGVAVPGGGMADAAKAALTGGDFRLEHGLGAFAEQEVDVADDAGADSGRTRAAPRAHRPDTLGGFNLPHRNKGPRSSDAVHRAGLDIDGRNDVVTGSNVGGDLLDQIALAVAIPQMMMRIDDFAVGIENFLFAQGEPMRPRIGIKTTLGGRGDGEHGWIFS